MAQWMRKAKSSCKLCWLTVRGAMVRNMICIQKNAFVQQRDVRTHGEVINCAMGKVRTPFTVAFSSEYIQKPPSKGVP